MKDVKVILENAGVDKDGEPLFVAYLELFPNETRTIAYEHIDATNNCIRFVDNFIFANFDAFPDYEWADYEVQPPYDEHYDIYQIDIVKMPNLIDSI